MGEDILNSISELEGVDIPQTVLNVSINDELGQTKNFSAQVEGISKTGFLPLLCRQGPGRSSLVDSPDPES